MGAVLYKRDPFQAAKAAEAIHAALVLPATAQEMSPVLGAFVGVALILNTSTDTGLLLNKATEDGLDPWAMFDGQVESLCGFQKGYTPTMAQHALKLSGRPQTAELAMQATEKVMTASNPEKRGLYLLASACLDWGQATFSKRATDLDVEGFEQSAAMSASMLTNTLREARALAETPPEDARAVVVAGIGGLEAWIDHEFGPGGLKALFADADDE